MGGVSATGPSDAGRGGHPDMDKMGLTFFASTTAVEPFSLALETGDLLTVTLGALAALKRVVLLVVLVIEVEAGAAMVAAAGWIFFVPAALPPSTRNFYVLGGVGLGGCCGVLIGRAIWTRIKKSFPEMSHHIFPELPNSWKPFQGIGFSRGRRAPSRTTWRAQHALLPFQQSPRRMERHMHFFSNRSSLTHVLPSQHALTPSPLSWP